ncbi:prepilin-type N-terminal cleavage/methylation domain-containing protein [Synechococcus sp. GreenBA-s]|nr:prepilin-type N-terminal cleavage/methylation domain-containing protein [Synechococcus sp. GreenBA-s]
MKQAKGFTLVELLIGLVLGSITLGMAAILVGSYIRSTGRALWTGQMEQDYGRISRLMKTEISEACLVQVSGSPSTTATLPATPCTPASATPCTTTTGTTLFLLVPVTLTNGTVTYRVISYSRTNDQLLRTGPPITATGALNTTADVANVVLIDTLTNGAAGFVPTVTTNCLSATIAFQFTNAAQGITFDRNLTVSVGSPAMAY